MSLPSLIKPGDDSIVAVCVIEKYPEAVNDCSLRGNAAAPFGSRRLALLAGSKDAICIGADDLHLEPSMLRTAIAVSILSIATIASAQNRPPGADPDVLDFCVYGGQFYSLGASICVGREVAIKCIRYGVVTNELRDLNAIGDDQARNRPVWLNFQQKLC